MTAFVHCWDAFAIQCCSGHPPARWRCGAACSMVLVAIWRAGAGLRAAHGRAGGRAGKGGRCRCLSQTAPFGHPYQFNLRGPVGRRFSKTLRVAPREKACPHAALRAFADLPVLGTGRTVDGILPSYLFRTRLRRSIHT